MLVKEGVRGADTRASREMLFGENFSTDRAVLLVEKVLNGYGGEKSRPTRRRLQPGKSK